MSDEIEPDILKKFRIQQRLGKGAYGIVWQVAPNRGDTVQQDEHINIFALKKCFDCFRNDLDAQRTYREVMYLKKLGGHDNVIELQNIHSSSNGRDLYILFHHMPTDLHAVCRAGILTSVQIRFIIYQILNALKYVHSAGIIHRDIKPSNILMDESCRVKLCDFGLARSMKENNGRFLTDYVATRWYRPPEILLCGTHYTEGIDVWAVACLLGEMIRGRPLLPGNSTMSQIEKILSLDFYSESDVHNGLSTFSSPMGNFMLDHVSVFDQISLKKLLMGYRNQGNPTPETIDFMQQCMAFDPSTRYSAEQCLSHVYLCDFHNPSYERMYERGTIRLPLDDNVKSPAHTYKKELEMMQALGSSPK